VRKPILVASVVTLVAACGSSNYVTACATIANIPVVVDHSQCAANRPGVMWYSTDASRLEEDDIPTVGQPLDDDFYKKESVTKPKTTKKLKPTKR
jgi:hypothetical protein